MCCTSLRFKCTQAPQLIARLWPTTVLTPAATRKQHGGNPIAVLEMEVCGRQDVAIVRVAGEDENLHVVRCFPYSLLQRKEARVVLPVRTGANRFLSRNR